MKKPNSIASGEMPRGLSLSPSQDQLINRILSDLLEKCPAQLILLAELSGQIVSVQGETGKTDLVALGALVAGDLAASQEIARLTGQYQHAQLIFREGPETTSFITEVGDRMVLYMRIHKEVPMGWARLIILEANRKLAEVVSMPAVDVEKLDLQLSDEKLDTLIGDGLDSIWHD
jgi:predicted regulator of Ras-like GTPase activity (Roadblock/LC7/MglB family)